MGTLFSLHLGHQLNVVRPLLQHPMHPFQRRQAVPRPALRICHLIFAIAALVPHMLSVRADLLACRCDCTYSAASSALRDSSNKKLCNTSSRAVPRTA